MRENVGNVDRIARSLLGPLLMLAAYTRLGAREGRLPGLIGFVAGALVIESAVTRVCPVNALLGLDTRTSRERIRDFRADIDEQSERIVSEYGRPAAAT